MKSIKTHVLSRLPQPSLLLFVTHPLLAVHSSLPPSPCSGTIPPSSPLLSAGAGGRTLHLVSRERHDLNQEGSSGPRSSLPLHAQGPGAEESGNGAKPSVPEGQARWCNRCGNPHDRPTDLVCALCDTLQTDRLIPVQTSGAGMSSRTAGPCLEWGPSAHQNPPSPDQPGHLLSRCWNV